jgi:hypothetical protein
MAPCSGRPRRGRQDRTHLLAAEQWQGERFNRALLHEWAYLPPYTSNQKRRKALTDFLHT